MTRKPSQWNLFVKKVYQEGKVKNKNYEFKQALVDASKRKSEMTHTASSSSDKKTITSKKKGGKSRNRSRTTSRSMSASMSISGGRKTRRHKKH